MVALLPLSRVVLSKVIVLLCNALLGREEHATPHGEVLAAHSEAGHSNHDHTHPLESINRGNVCTEACNTSQSHILPSRQG